MNTDGRTKIEDRGSKIAYYPPSSVLYPRPSVFICVHLWFHLASHSETTSACGIAARSPSSKLAAQPAANVVTEPISTYHCHETPVNNLTASITAAPKMMPT